MFKFARRFNDTNVKGWFNFIFIGWLAILIANFAIIGFGIWVVIKLMAHFGVI